jgi:hypothetical protein
MFFQANRTNQHYHLRLLLDIIVNSEMPNAEFPWSQRVGAHRFPMARFDRRLVRELFIDGIQDNSLLTRRQVAQVFFSRGRVFDTVRQVGARLPYEASDNDLTVIL